MPTIGNSRGFALISVMIALGIIPVAILAAVQLNQIVRSSQRAMQSSQSKQSMQIVKNYLVANSADPDNDGYHELLKEGTGNALPLSIPMNPNDQWGSAIRFCTWDLGSANGNATYSQNFVAPPKAQMIGKLISAGPDKTFQTACSDMAANGDDNAAEIYESDARSSSGTFGGWTDLGSALALLTGTDQVGIGTQAPAAGAKVHVDGGGVLVGVNGSSSAARTLTLMESGQSQINYGSFPGSWTAALQIQSGDPTQRFLWVSPLASNSGSNARVTSGNTGIDFYTGATAATQGNKGLAIDTSGNLSGAGTSGAIRINSGNGYVDVGPMNTSWSHFQTDRPAFYFNKDVYVNGRLGGYSGSIDSTYTAMTVKGEKNAYSGLHFRNSTGSNMGNLMMHPNYKGIYDEAYGWNLLCYQNTAGNVCTSVGGFTYAP